MAGRLHGFGDAALDRRDPVGAARLYRESLEIGRPLRDDLQTAYCLAGLAAVAAEQGRRDVAALLWGFVRAGEERSGDRLHETERARYGRVLGELERLQATAADFALGRALTLDEAVELALAH